MTATAPTPSAPTVTARARTIVDDVVARLIAEPVQAAIPSALNEGDSGRALLLAEVCDGDADARRQMHACLRSAATGGLPGHGGLYYGATAVAFAARAAAGGRSYTGFLTGLDRHITEEAHARAAADRAVRASSVLWLGYDVITGLSGVGRYLLCRTGAPGVDEALAAVLRALIDLTEPVVVNGRERPGWWVSHALTPDGPDDPAGGHANLGLAHGIPGPLALLSLAWSQGVRLPGQDRAIAYIADWLCAWADHDEHGPYWSSHLSVSAHDHPELPRPRARMAWCYGTPGVARGLQLAGQALGNLTWQERANTAMHAALLLPEERWSAFDASLCHGTAGLLHLVATMARDYPAEGFEPAVDRLAAWTVASYEPTSRYGFTFYAPGSDVRPDRAGFLDGAAGVALALHAYARGAASTTGWETALCIG